MTNSENFRATKVQDIVELLQNLPSSNFKNKSIDIDDKTDNFIKELFQKELRRFQFEIDKLLLEASDLPNE